MPLASDLNNVDSSVVTWAFQELSTEWKRKRIIAAQNKFSKDTINKLKSRNTASIVGASLPKYISSSSIVHVIDGWNYFEQTTRALLDGNFSIAMHLAYYAELRANMALLASHGIGVFDKKHYYCATTNTCSSFSKNKPTHQFAWECLIEWSNFNNNMNIIGKIIRPLGVPLIKWLSAFTGSPIASYNVSSSLLKEWGVDLKDCADDQQKRNEASYRPDFLKQNSYKKAPVFLKELWNLLEPSSAPFSLLDQFVLKESLAKIDPQKDPSKISIMLNSLYQSGELSPNPIIQNFLTSPEELSIIKYAKQENPVNKKEKTLSMISRALLLLRLATGSVEQQLESSKIDRSDLNFLWKRDLHSHLKTSGLSSSKDLWEDINLDDDDLKKIFKNYKNSCLSDSDYKNLKLLSSFEVASFWGLNL